jgi:hypothetical protein
MINSNNPFPLLFPSLKDLIERCCEKSTAEYYNRKEARKLKNTRFNVV